jgi:hypothetical protein
MKSQWVTNGFPNRNGSPDPGKANLRLWGNNGGGVLGLKASINLLLKNRPLAYVRWPA